MKGIKGYCYASGKAMELTRAEWRARLQEVLKLGGFRRAEGGETFAHDSKGIIVFEVYTILPA